MTYVHQCGKAAFLFCLLVLPESPLFLLLTLSKFDAGIVSSFFHSLSTASFASGIFIACGIRINFVHQIVMCHRSKPFTCNVILVVFGLRRFCSLSRRFKRFHNTIIHCFELLFIANLWICIRFRDTWLSLTRHRGSHRSSSSLLAFLRIPESSLSSGSTNQVDSSPSLRIVELWFFFCPFLIVSILSSFAKLLATHDPVW